MSHGKIFIVLLVTNALVVTSLVLSGSAAGQNPAEIQSRLNNALKENQQLKAVLAKLEALLAEGQAVRARLQAENEQLKKALAEVQQQGEPLRAEIRQAQAERDKHFRSVVELTEQLHKAFNELKQLKEINARLSALLPEPPAKVLRGIVTATEKDGSVEISLGGDDGLRPGHRLSVYRTSAKETTVLGRIMVVKTAPDKALCKVDPGTLKGPIQKGDLVTTGQQPAGPAAAGPPQVDGTRASDQPPLLVGGQVLAVLEDGRVEISFGAADGLRPGHRLEVYRVTGSQGIYVGRIEVVEAGPQKSLCKTILEQDTIQKGDRITSRL